SSNFIKRARNPRSAASFLSGGKFAIIEDVNYVLVENEPDAKFYNIVYNKFLASGRLNPKGTKLIFEPVGVNLNQVRKEAENLLSELATIIENNPDLENLLT